MPRSNGHRPAGTIAHPENLQRIWIEIQDRLKLGFKRAIPSVSRRPATCCGTDATLFTASARLRAGHIFERTTMAITASFVPGTGVLTATGDGLDNAITASRDAAGNILVNGGAVPIAGGTATVANTTLIQAFGQDGNDTIALDETNGALPNAALFGGNGTDTLIGGSGNDVVVGGTGNDVALLGTGNDTFFWNPGDGSDIVEGQAGIDRLDFAAANSTRASTSRPTAGACACPAMSAASRWTSMMSSGSMSTLSAAPTPW